MAHSERQTQNRVIQLFRNTLGYSYLGNLEDKPNNSNLIPEILERFLTSQGYSPKLVQDALKKLRDAITDTSQGLYQANKTVYNMLRYGVSIKENQASTHKTVRFVNWQHPEQNIFSVAEEVTIKGRHTKRPDIVLYLNGIAVAVLELKRSSVYASEGIRQNITNQSEQFIQAFFSTMQLVMAGNDSQGLYYGTIETQEKYYLTWQEDTLQPISAHRLDNDLYFLCQKERLLELLYNFVIYDSGIKKLCRYNQFRAIQKAKSYVTRKKGGIIWHTQGSGKSLTMVWLAKWIRENVENARVLIITDRKELDSQIENIFNGVSENIRRTTSGTDLVNCLNQADQWLIGSLIHKFKANQKEADVDTYINEIKSALPKGFKAKGNMYVFIDECHRSQSGKLHTAMKEILGEHATLIGFTGTPLLKKDKSPTHRSSVEVFGGYIDVYTSNVAVQDKVVLDLQYEARDVEQWLSSPQRMDAKFEEKTRELKPDAAAELKKRWVNMQKVLSTKDRIERIVADVITDMDTKPRLKSKRGNAMLVCQDIYTACRYYDTFQRSGFTECAMVTSYVPTLADLKETEVTKAQDEKKFQYQTYTTMLGGKTPEAFEEEAKRLFVKEPARMRLLIVVDKLLTGFDAPSATYLYIDKSMKDHGLFQAICRVNRLDGEDKDFGYIVDYKDLFKQLESSIQSYTQHGGAFENFEPADVEHILKNHLIKKKERLEQAREVLQAAIDDVPHASGQARTFTDYQHYFCHAPTPEKALQQEVLRQQFYKIVREFLRAYANISSELPEAGYTPEQAQKLKSYAQDIKDTYTSLITTSGDRVDFRVLEADMRHLLDSHVRAEDSTTVAQLDTMGLIDFIYQKNIHTALDYLPPLIATSEEAIAETITNNFRRRLKEEQDKDPAYYNHISTLLNTLIAERNTNSKSYQQFLTDMQNLIVSFKERNAKAYPSDFTLPLQKTLYDLLDENADMVRKVWDVVEHYQGLSNWQTHIMKERAYKRSLIEAMQQASPELSSDNAQEKAGVILERVKAQAHS